jgi:hypothetical protein
MQPSWLLPVLTLLTAIPPAAALSFPPNPRPPNPLPPDLLDLLPGDLLVFSQPPSPPSLGCLLTANTLQPLCLWSADLHKSLLERDVDARKQRAELVWDEEQAALALSSVRVHSVLPFELVQQSSRQVGGGMGPSNPHGEHVEDTFELELGCLMDECPEEVELPLRPDREIFW